MSKKKALIIIASVALLIIGALIAFYFYFSKSNGLEGGFFQKGDDVTGFPTDNTIGGGDVDDGTGGDGDDTTGGSGNGDGDGDNTGGNGGTGSNTSGSSGAGSANITPSGHQILRKLSSAPVAGASIFKDPLGNFIVRYVDRAKGHVYEVNASAGDANRITNKLLPKIYEAYFTNSGAGFIARYLKDETDEIQSFSAQIKDSSAGLEKTLEGLFLPLNITGLAVAPNAQEKIFYTMSGTSGNTTGITANADGTRKTELFSTPLREWLVSWPETNTIALNTKPSSEVPGFLYFADPRVGELKKVLGGIYGLTTLVSPDASHVLYSETSSSILNLKIFDTKTLTTKTITGRTLPEKCTWSRTQKNYIYCAFPQIMTNGRYPDSWYQGKISFNDDIWSVDTDTGKATLIASPKTLVDEEMDAINLDMSSDGSYIIFVNKKDLNLWLLDLRM